LPPGSLLASPLAAAPQLEHGRRGGTDDMSLTIAPPPVPLSPLFPMSPPQDPGLQLVLGEAGGLAPSPFAGPIPSPLHEAAVASSASADMPPPRAPLPQHPVLLAGMDGQTPSTNTSSASSGKDVHFLPQHSKGKKVPPPQPRRGRGRPGHAEPPPLSTPFPRSPWEDGLEEEFEPGQDRDRDRDQAVQDRDQAEWEAAFGRLDHLAAESEYPPSLFSSAASRGSAGGRRRPRGGRRQAAEDQSSGSPPTSPEEEYEDWAPKPAGGGAVRGQRRRSRSRGDGFPRDQGKAKKRRVTHMKHTRAKVANTVEGDKTTAPCESLPSSPRQPQAVSPPWEMPCSPGSAAGDPPGELAPASPTVQFLHNLMVEQNLDHRLTAPDSRRAVEVMPSSLAEDDVPDCPPMEMMLPPALTKGKKVSAPSHWPMIRR